MGRDARGFVWHTSHNGTKSKPSVQEKPMSETVTIDLRGRLLTFG